MGEKRERRGICLTRFEGPSHSSAMRREKKKEGEKKKKRGEERRSPRSRNEKARYFLSREKKKHVKRGTERMTK